MPTFKVTEKATGKEVHKYSAPAPVEWKFMEFATHDHTPMPYTPLPPGTHIAGAEILTHREFRDKFTEQEKNDIDRFEATYESFGLSADVEDRIRSGLKDYYSALDIDRSDVRVPMLLGVFAGFGCISPERIDEVIYGA